MVQEVVVTVDTRDIGDTAEMGREVRIALGVVAMVAMGVVVKDTVVRSDGDSKEVEDSSVTPAMLVVVLMLIVAVVVYAPLTLSTPTVSIIRAGLGSHHPYCCANMRRLVGGMASVFYLSHFTSIHF